MTTEKAHFTVKSSKKSVSEIFRATKNLIFALDPLCTLNAKITLLYESGRYRWGEGGQKITSIGRYL